jgi:hypothetical protein
MFIKNGKPDLAEGFTLRCLQRLSRPYVGYPAMLLAEQLAHQRYVPPNPLVLGRKPRKFPAPTADRDRPVSRRSKPSSRTAFIGEQPNPWELLHPQDAMSRHRTNIHDYAWRRLYHHLVSDFSQRNGMVFDLSSKVGMTRVGVLPQTKNMSEAFPFGSVVTGSTITENDGRLPTVLPRDNSLAGASDS